MNLTSEQIKAIEEAIANGGDITLSFPKPDVVPKQETKTNCGPKPSLKVGDCFYNKKGNKYTIINYIDANNLIVRFNNTGYTVCTQACNVKSGAIKDVLAKDILNIACIGDGYFKSKSGGKDTKAYRVWSGILHRCYNKKILIETSLIKM